MVGQLTRALTRLLENLVTFRPSILGHTLSAEKQLRHPASSG